MDFFEDSKYLYNFLNREEFNLIYYENFKNQIYKPILKNHKVILDIGAHIGLSTLYFKKILPESTIIAYEPNPYLFEALKTNIDINNIKKCKLFNAAISKSKQENIDFYIDIKNQWYSTGSLLNKGWTKTQHLERIKINTISFEDALKYSPDFIKMDIEGIEFSLIKDNQEKLETVTELVIEFHNLDDGKFDKLVNILKKIGFTVKYSVDKTDKRLIIINAYKTKR